MGARVLKIASAAALTIVLCASGAEAGPTPVQSNPSVHSYELAKNDRTASTKKGSTRAWLTRKKNQTASWFARQKAKLKNTGR